MSEGNAQESEWTCPGQAQAWDTRPPSFSRISIFHLLNPGFIHIEGGCVTWGIWRAKRD